MRSFFFASCLALVACSLAADEPPPKPTTETTSTKTERYLGVVTEALPEPLAAQLKDLIPQGQGLLVKRVLPDSPAAKSGLAPFDVLSTADGQPLASSADLKKLVATHPPGEGIKLNVIRGAKTQTLDVVPGERTVSRIVHRHFSPAERAEVEAASAAKPDAASNDAVASAGSFSVSVQTRDSRTFRVEIRVTPVGEEARTHAFSGTSTEIAARTKSLPEGIQRAVTRQIARLTEDAPPTKSVQFRFQPRREGRRQMLAVSLRKPAANGTVTSFEWQRPVDAAARPLSLDGLLDVPDVAAQLKDLDPVVRDKIAATLRTASLPAGKLNVEDSQ